MKTEVTVGTPTESRVFYKWAAFSAVAIGTFVVLMDFGGVGVALPTIADEFNLQLATASWIVISGALTISAILLPAGGFSDIFGRKRSYVSGLIIYAIAAAISGFAPSLIPMVFTRVFAAVGSAMMMANGMATVMTVFPADERGKAMGLITLSVGLGAIAGPIVAGLMVELFGWESFFFLLSFGAFVAAVVSATVLDESRISVKQRGSFLEYDWPGAIFSAAALTLLILVLTIGNQIGWNSIWVIGGVALSIVFGTSFIFRELNTRTPMFNLHIFSNTRFSWPIAARALGFFGGSGYFFIMPFYLQDVLGYTPSKIGFITFPGAFGFAVVGAISGRYSDRFGVRPFTVAGLTLSIIGALMLASLSTDSNLFLIMPALLLSGVGTGLWVAPNMSAVVASVERSSYGVISAFLNLVRNTATVTAVAVITAIVVGVMNSRGFDADLSVIGDGIGPGAGDAFIIGARIAYLFMAVILGIGLFAAIKTPEPENSPVKEM